MGISKKRKLLVCQDDKRSVVQVGLVGCHLFFVNLMHTTVDWEVKDSLVQLLLPDWPMGIIAGHFLDYD